MKIAVLIDTWFPFVGGGQINAWEISRRLAQNNVEVEVITRNCGVDFHKSQKNLKVTKLGPPSKPANDTARIKYLVQAFLYLLNKDYDLLVAHTFLPGLVVRLLMLTQGKRAVLVVHGSSIGSQLNKGFKLWLEKFILTRIKYSAQITVSRDFFKIDNVNKDIVYIPNGFDPVYLKHNSSKTSNSNTLLFIGRLHPQKNLICLIEAMKILKSEANPANLTIIGDGPQKQELQHLIKKYALQNIVTLVGEKSKEQLISYYQHSMAFILPSIYEGQPLTLLEAWASKLPVIVSKTGDNMYLVKDGENGYFIQNQNDPKSIAQTIKKALKNPNLKKLGQNGYNLVKDKYTWENSARETKKLYEKILKSSHD